MTFQHPSNRVDTGPQIAIDGSTLYVAFTRLRPTDGGCGDDGLVDVGVYYRTRQLTSDAWTNPVRIGNLADHLQSFRVQDGVMHWTFVGHDGRGPISYGRRTGSSFRSVVLPRALETSLRVGDDGLARIAYSTGDRIRYGTVHADGSLTSKTIFSSNDMVATWPNLVLGEDNHAYVTFAAHLDVSGGCAEPDNPVSKPGTYIATNGSGAWVVRRLTKDIGPASLVVDTRTAEVSIALQLDRGIREYTGTPDGMWSGATIRGTGSTSDAVIRRDPTTGRLLLVATRWDEDVTGTQVIALVKR